MAQEIDFKNAEVQESLRAWLKEGGYEVEKITTKFDSASASLEQFMALGSQFQGSKTGGMTPAFRDLNAAISDSSTLFQEVAGFMGDAGSKIPGVGGAFKAVFKTLSLGSNITEKFATGFVSGTKKTLDAADSMSAKIRMFDKTVFDFSKQMGGTLDSAKGFMRELDQETASDFARSMYITKDSMMKFVEAASSTSLSQDQLNQTIDTGVGSAKLYNVAAAQAGAMNISLGEAAGLLNKAMNKQGKSAQGAAEMLGMFSGVAKNVGLRAETVAQTLNSAVDGFTKLGLSADFGRPILEGFGQTMDDMGLGIENAIDLTSSLTSALASLTTNYANAYLVFQRGGLDIGGGGGSGVLGASIGLQAAMLEAEKTGDQSEIASQLTTGLRDTLASFTGGEIVTVEQAAESPGLQNQFYIQQQMLKTQFGVGDDQSATRILDMLSRLDDATRSGDMDTKQQLEEQLKNEMEGKDKTTDLAEKAAQEMAIQSNLNTLQLRELADINRNMGELLLSEFVSPTIEKVGKTTRTASQWGTEATKAQLAKLPKETRDLLMEGHTGGALKNEMGKEEKWDVGLETFNEMSRSDKTGAVTVDLSKIKGIGGDFEVGSESYQREIENAAAYVASQTDDATLSRLGEGGMTKQELMQALIEAAEKQKSTVVRIELSPDVNENFKASKEVNKQVGNATKGVR